MYEASHMHVVWFHPVCAEHIRYLVQQELFVFVSFVQVMVTAAVTWLYYLRCVLSSAAQLVVLVCCVLRAWLHVCIFS
jgi:hypothetical protein